MERFNLDFSFLANKISEYVISKSISFILSWPSPSCQCFMRTLMPTGCAIRNNTPALARSLMYLASVDSLHPSVNQSHRCIHIITLTGDTSFLLGGWPGPRKDGGFGKLKPDLAMVAATINFAARTGRLDNEIRPVNQEQEGDLLDGEGEEGEEGNE